MAALGVRVTAWQGLSARDKTILQFVGEVLALGAPARFRQPNNTEWFVFDDGRFKPSHVAWLGCIMANLNQIPSGYQLPTDGEGNLDKVTLRQQIMNALGDIVVLPRDIQFVEDDPNPWQTILDAQGAPVSVQMGSGVPENWTVVNDEPA